MPFVRGGFVRGVKTGVLVLGLAALAACSSGGPRTFQTQEQGGGFSLFGLGGGKKASSTNANQPAIGVNGYLWRATLDTLSFMPLASADPFGGVIITDWYANPSNPGERMKVTVSILDRDLRADALRVAASRQVSQGGAWVDAPVQAATVQKLEEIILTRARDLRRSAIEG